MLGLIIHHYFFLYIILALTYKYTLIFFQLNKY